MNGIIEIHTDNAYLFADNYAIYRKEDGLGFVGCEHNQSEAEAIAKWVQYRTGSVMTVQYNRPDQVAKAKALRGGREVPRYQLREEALIDMGVWPAPSKGRRK